MSLTLEECITALGRERATEILTPHVASAKPPTPPEPPSGLPYRRVACVGVGTIGASWAAFYASRGLEVALYDQTPEKVAQGLQAATAALERLENCGLLARGAAALCVPHLHTTTSLAEAVQDAELIQESAFEDYAVKAEVWRGIEKHAPHTAVIAASTSGLLISRMAEVLEHPERALVAHPFNPPHLINLVELVPGPKTATKVLTNVREFYQQLGKAPVEVKKEVYGHIANRLQAAIWREAVSLVHRGVATVADVDSALHEGPGVRWALLGMHAIFDLGGGGGAYRGFFEGPIGKGCYEEVWPTLEAWPSPPPEAKEASIAGISDWHAGRSRQELAAWRDERLAEIIRMKRQSPPWGGSVKGVPS